MSWYLKSISENRVLAKRLKNYPDLDRWLESNKNKFNVQEFHCSLGAEGQFYVNNLSRGQYAKLDPSIMKEIKARFINDKYGGDPVKLTIGIGYAYVMVGKKGDICWNLRGNYSNLDKILCEANSGVKVSDFFWFDFGLLCI